jgi:hypothetical protein
MNQSSSKTSQDPKSHQWPPTLIQQALTSKNKNSKFSIEQFPMGVSYGLQSSSSECHQILMTKSETHLDNCPRVFPIVKVHIQVSQHVKLIRLPLEFIEELILQQYRLISVCQFNVPFSSLIRDMMLCIMCIAHCRNV